MGDFTHACGFGQADFLDDVYLGDGNGAAEAGRSSILLMRP